jgi:hypothetical protein
VDKVVDKMGISVDNFSVHLFTNIYFLNIIFYVEPKY